MVASYGIVIQLLIKLAALSYRPILSIQYNGRRLLRKLVRP